MHYSDFFIGLELTRHCNLRCQHCLRDDLDKRAELPIEFVEKILREARAYKKPHIALTGGEATLHSQFGEIIDLIVREGYSFHFVTNGTTFPKTFNRLRAYAGTSAWRGISVSMDGATEETMDAIRGKGVYRKAMQAIAIAKTHGVPVTAQMVVNRLNRNEMRLMAEMCAAMKVDRLFFSHMQPTAHGLHTDIVLPPSGWEDVDNEIAQLKRAYRMNIEQAAGYYDLVPLSHCRFLRNGALNIDYRGRLTVCCQMSNTGGVEDTDQDVVADLTETSLTEGHTRLLDVYNDIHKARIRKLEAGEMNQFDHYHCWFCMKHFKKLSFFKAYPDNPWVTGDKDLSAEIKPNEQLKQAR